MVSRVSEGQAKQLFSKMFEAVEKATVPPKINSLADRLKPATPRTPENVAKLDWQTAHEVRSGQWSQ